MQLAYPSAACGMWQKQCWEEMQWVKVCISLNTSCKSAARWQFLGHLSSKSWGQHQAGSGQQAVSCFWWRGWEDLYQEQGCSFMACVWMLGCGLTAFFLKSYGDYSVFELDALTKNVQGVLAVMERPYVSYITNVFFSNLAQISKILFVRVCLMYIICIQYHIS